MGWDVRDVLTGCSGALNVQGAGGVIGWLWQQVLDFDQGVEYGPGYRVYYKKQGREIVVLLAGGDKRTQAKDIENALRLARNL